MPARHRTKSGGLQSGGYSVRKTRLSIAEYFGDDVLSFDQSMDDVVGNKNGDNPVNLVRVGRTPGWMSGYKELGPGAFLSADSRYFALPNPPGHINMMGEPGPQAAATMGAAQANPSQPSVNLPVSIAELRELPRMLFASNRKRQRSGNSVAEMNFGWEPMIRDTKKLFTFPSMVESRIKTITALKRGKLSRRRLVFSGTETYISDVERSVNSYPLGMDVWARLSVTHKNSVSVTSRWVPNRNILGIGDEAIAKYARAAVLGLNTEQFLSAAWELLPWSWLADWFYTLGDVMSLTNQVLAYSNGLACVSTRRRSEATDIITKNPEWMFVTPGMAYRYTWNRQMWDPFIPSITVPLLSHGQTLTLAGIANNLRAR